MFPTFLRLAFEKHINLMVVTGGFSDISATMFNQYVDVLKYPELQILGCEMVFDKNNILDIDMKINSVGKFLSIDNERIGNRKNIILLGDILADVNMIKKINYENLIKIGFLNRPLCLEEDVKRYLTKYDVVIAYDGSWKEPLRILKEITG